MLSTLLKWRYCEYYSSNVAGFDLDSTIIKTKSGRKFGKNADDWMWLYKCVPDKLKSLQDEGFNIVIFTNQSGLKTEEKRKEFERKLENIFVKNNIKVEVIAALNKDKYRKPLPNMFTECKAGFDKQKSFYVGDAAGRKQDFSDSDYKFALNLGIKFYTPEDYFLGIKERLPVIKKLIENNKDIDIKTVYDKELIILVGLPSSGKSTFAKDKLKEYTIINQDMLKTKAKCIAKCKNEMKKNSSKIVIDNTNINLETRKIYLDLAKDNGYCVRIFIFKTSIELCHHLNTYRDYTGERKRIPDIVYNIMKKKYTEPMYSENENVIKEIRNIDISIKRNNIMDMYLT